MRPMEADTTGIKPLREARGLTLQEVAFRCGVSISIVQTWDKSILGTRAKNLVAIGECLGVPLDVLCGLKSYEIDKDGNVIY